MSPTWCNTGYGAQLDVSPRLFVLGYLLCHACLPDTNCTQSASKNLSNRPEVLGWQSLPTPTIRLLNCEPKSGNEFPPIEFSNLPVLKICTRSAQMMELSSDACFQSRKLDRAGRLSDARSRKFALGRLTSSGCQYEGFLAPYLLTRKEWQLQQKAVQDLGFNAQNLSKLTTSMKLRILVPEDSRRAQSRSRGLSPHRWKWLYPTFPVAVRSAPLAMVILLPLIVICLRQRGQRIRCLAVKGGQSERQGGGYAYLNSDVAGLVLHFAARYTNEIRDQTSKRQTIYLPSHVSS